MQKLYFFRTLNISIPLYFNDWAVENQPDTDQTSSRHLHISRRPRPLPSNRSDGLGLSDLPPKYTELFP